MNPLLEHDLLQTRRQFFGRVGLRLGQLGLATLLGRRALAESGLVHPPHAGLPHFAARAKAVIYLHMNGGPSQIDLWDHKPGLQKWFDQDVPPSIKGTQRMPGMSSQQPRFPVAPSLFQFAQYGQSGRWLSELMPHTARHVDKLAVIRSVHTNAINHDPASTFVMTGSEIPGNASIGSWLSYGLGSVSNDLPAFVVLTPSWKTKNSAQPALPTRMWSSGFLSSEYTGVPLRAVGDPVLYTRNPPGVAPANRRAMLDTLSEMNARGFERLGDPETQTRMAQYEMAFRMQTSVPELTDFSTESPATLDAYGPEARKPGSFASSALLARRLVERGVRVVQVLHRGWDQHSDLPRDLQLQCQDTDQAVAALLTDLETRGLLDSTLVVWGGEFGRTVFCQGALTKADYGRDHHPSNFTMWMAGGGVKGGVCVGETDDFSYNVVADPVHLNDLNATILHCCGLDHERFTFMHQGLNTRLTGVERAKVVKSVLL